MVNYVFFPYLKTTHQVIIGGYTFYSSNDVSKLNENDSRNIVNLANMFYLRNDYKIENCIYTIVETSDTDEDDQMKFLQKIKNIRNILAYLYSFPRLEFDGLFLKSSNSTSVIFNIEKVNQYTIFPENNTINTGKDLLKAFDQHGLTNGFHGKYDNKSDFWVIRGCRIYPEDLSLVLNISQNLYSDYNSVLDRNRNDLKLLFNLLNTDVNSLSRSRIYTSLNWYKLAISNPDDFDNSIACLSIAFESLLGLPADEKTSRIVDAISLLIGRPERIEHWANQFYSIRSSIIHEGKTNNLFFSIPGKNKNKVYGSIYNYGLKIYQLCISTVLFGVNLAEMEKLPEYFKSNQERLESIIKIITDNETNTDDIDILTENIIALSNAILENGYVAENDLTIELLLTVVNKLLTLGIKYSVFSDDNILREANIFLSINSKSDKLVSLESLNNLNKQFRNSYNDIQTLDAAIICIIKYVWRKLTMTYIYLKK